MFFLTCCDRTSDWIFIPSQSCNWQLVLLKWKTPETRKVLSDRTPWCALPLRCCGRMDGHEALLSAWDATTLEFGSKSHNIYDYESPQIPFFKWWFQETYQTEGQYQAQVRGFRTSIQTNIYTSRQSYLPRDAKSINLFPSCDLSLSSVSETKWIAAILHTCAGWNMLKCRLPSEQANCCPLHSTLLAKSGMCPFFVCSPKKIWNSFCSPSVCPSPVQTSDCCELVEITKLSRSMPKPCQTKPGWFWEPAFRTIAWKMLLS